MNAETLFTICNFAALAGWVLLVFLPRWEWTSRIVLSGVASLALAVVYLVLVVTTLPKADCRPACARPNFSLQPDIGV